MYKHADGVSELFNTVTLLVFTSILVSVLTLLTCIVGRNQILYLEITSPTRGFSLTTDSTACDLSQMPSPATGHPILRTVYSFFAGMSGAFWSETVRTPKQLYSLIHPRLLALAERAWHKAKWENTTDMAERDREKAEDWERFSNSLGYKELARLDKLNVEYHLPPPGAR